MAEDNPDTGARRTPKGSGRLGAERRRRRRPPPRRRRRTPRECWAALAAFEVSGAAAGWLARVTWPRQEFPRQLEAAWDPAAAPELGGAAFPTPSLPPPPPASARLIILLIDKQRLRRRLSACVCSQVMGDKKSPTRPKRQPKPSSDEGYWDCSVCTFRNSAEAFKCMMCDVRKGTSTRSTFFEVIVNASWTMGLLKFPISGSSSGCPSGRFPCWTEGQERWICEGKDPIG
ncbi:YY1-associated factor 2 isoform X3 [Cervus elaphus]|uniref:YY1-associated factor 2 isoform X3 n=1 Tax=Cervus elaphus TaxID=9860 RepID=UPI001CC2877E|nr:YY1-associated factor 2 isoform X3 [Cervus elaphus]XP_043742744.1 YY1-associated factor 2 isoform X3 [Cervus elaphus]